MNKTFKSTADDNHCLQETMGMQEKASNQENSNPVNKQYYAKIDQVCREMGIILDENDLFLLDNPESLHNTVLSTDPPEEFLYKILKHYIKRNRYEKIIRFVTDSVHKSLDLGEVIENALDSMNKHIETAENVSIYMVEGNNAVLKSYRGYPEHLIKKLLEIPRPKGFTWQTIISGNPIYCPDVDTDPYIGLKGKKLGTKSYVSMPIMYMGKAIGCLNINSTKKHAFDNDELDLLKIVANQIETAINNAKQTEAIRSSKEALKKAHNQLEQRVQERTSEIEKSNTLLIKEILERRCAESGLKQSLAEKDVLLKEIHHRIKNNLQIISSLLNLQSRNLKDSSALSSFNESNNRIRSIATLHEQLYRSKDLSRINFTTYIRNMTNNLLHSYGVTDNSIKIIVNSEHIYLDINTAIPCGLIVNELVSNAIKHGFPERKSGEVTVDFNRFGDKYILKVSNNGIKFPPELDINNCTTLGLELVSSLSKQLKGSLSLERENLTKFQLEFSR
jgi:two-component sensor histidine kinase/putative methionine-R-sulfoxide reductase with GAF domain